jgi:hypothetical protein
LESLKSEVTALRQQLQTERHRKDRYEEWRRLEAERKIEEERKERERQEREKAKAEAAEKAAYDLYLDDFGHKGKNTGKISLFKPYFDLVDTKPKKPHLEISKTDMDFPPDFYPKTADFSILFDFGVHKTPATPASLPLTIPPLPDSEPPPPVTALSPPAVTQPALPSTLPPPPTEVAPPIPSTLPPPRMYSPPVVVPVLVSSSSFLVLVSDPFFSFVLCSFLFAKINHW